MHKPYFELSNMIKCVSNITSIPPSLILNPSRGSCLQSIIIKTNKYDVRVVYPIDQSIVNHRLTLIVPIHQDKESDTLAKTACMAQTPHHEPECIYTHRQSPSSNTCGTYLK